ncbi:hypothetical protein DMA11_14425 [Marinilabiliaceae bacterium JC017]|nr:hypothetical protein DMA11_14425 [Marinilabiliaceae bacterium JC017]
MPGTISATKLVPGKCQVPFLRQSWCLGKARLHFCDKVDTWEKPGCISVTKLTPGKSQVALTNTTGIPDEKYKSKLNTFEIKLFKGQTFNKLPQKE